VPKVPKVSKVPKVESGIYLLFERKNNDEKQERYC
jgi:hypothetical protein